MHTPRNRLPRLSTEYFVSFLSGREILNMICAAFYKGTSYIYIHKLYVQYELVVEWSTLRRVGQGKVGKEAIISLGIFEKRF